MATNAIEINRGRFYWLKDKFKEDEDKEGKKEISMSIVTEEEEEFDLDYGDHIETSRDE